MNRTNNFAKNSLVFLFGTLTTKVVYFFLIPLYTYYLTPQEYGFVELIQTTIVLLIPIITCNIAEAVFRFSMDKDADVKVVFSMSTRLVVICILIISLLAIFIIQFLNYEKYYYLIIVILFFECYRPTLKQFAKAIDKISVFIFGDLICSCILLISNIILLGNYQFGIYGFFLSLLIAYFFEFIYFIFLCRFYKYFLNVWDKKLFNQMIRYSIPIIPNALLWWVISLSDRYILAMYTSVASVAIYSVANKIPAIITIIQGAILSSWKLVAVKSKDDADSGKYFSDTFDILSAFSALLVSIYLLFNNFIFKLFFSDTYSSAALYAPWLILVAFLSFYTSYFATMYIVSKKSLPATLTTLIGAATNILFNFLLIPKFQIGGAVTATIISYLIVYFLRYRDLRKIFKIQINIKLNLLSTLLILLQAFFINYKTSYNNYIVLMLVLIQFVLYKNQIQILISLLKNRMKKMRY